MDAKLGNEIIKAIDMRIDQRFKELTFNYYLEGKITAINGDGTYNVQINNDTSTMKARAGLTLQVNNICFICVPNANYSNKFIDCIRP